jgi:hypothetical protein
VYCMVASSFYLLPHTPYFTLPHPTFTYSPSRTALFIGIHTELAPRIGTAADLHKTKVRLVCVNSVSRTMAAASQAWVPAEISIVVDTSRAMCVPTRHGGRSSFGWPDDAIVRVQHANIFLGLLSNITTNHGSSFFILTHPSHIQVHRFVELPPPKLRLNC